MGRKLMVVLVLLTGLSAAGVRADVLVLVHGYFSGAGSWETSGITSLLVREGWQPGGVFVTDPAGSRLIAGPGGSGNRTFYTVDLPSEAPILIQAYRLRQILEAINSRHPGEPLILAGHSAGGVVARLALVRGDIPNARVLITIASPHLGTVRAEQALDVTDIPFPFSLMTDFFGGAAYDTAMRSRGLFADLVRPRPGTLLYWLNTRTHPDIAYVSVVRGQAAVLTGDYVVPGYSQDMNNVPALSGRSMVVNANNTSHGLTPHDGEVILGVLAQLL